MEEKQRQTLERNRHLLLKNIILTDSFYYHLKRENVLPDTMLRDIQNGQTREDRNSILLETLRLRGCDSYRKFCHVLYLTGHHFLADHMYAEEVDARILKGDELFTKFPQIFSQISDDLKNKLVRYLESKVREKVLHNAWLTSGPERSDVLETKSLAYDNEKDFRRKLDNKIKKIQCLQEELAVTSEEMKKRDGDLATVMREADEMRRLYKEDLATQTRFNAANNSSILQLRERFDTFNERVKTLNMALRNFLHEGHVDNSEEDPDDMKLSMLEKNIRKVIQIARANLEATSSNSIEKEAVINILKTSSRQQQHSLTEIVRTYVERQEKGKQRLSQEIGDLLELLQGRRIAQASGGRQGKADLKMIKSQVATLRVQVEHIKKKLEWKDNQITELIQENAALRDSNIRPQVGPPQPSMQGPVPLPKISTSPGKNQASPDSAREMETVYKQLDRYILEATTPPPQPVRRRKGSLAEVNLEREQSPPLRLRNRIQFVDQVQEGQQLPGTVKRVLTDQTVSQNKDTSRTDNGSAGDQSKESTSGNTSREPSETLYRRDRRPSLTELITIFENSQTQSTDKDKRTELQTVPEHCK